MTKTNCGSDQKRKSFFDFVDEVFTGDFKSFTQRMKDFGDEFQKGFTESWDMYPLMNVIEGSKGYRLELAAPGLNKQAFKISLEEDKLKISADLEVSLEDDEKFKRREFNFHKFKRTFKLPENVDTDKIEAKYEDGILKVLIPKQVEDTKDEREINIS